MFGSPGTGKTELVKRYSADSKNAYEHRWFVQAKNWEKDYRKLALFWGLFPASEINSIDVEVVVDQVHSVFSMGERSLIIFDDSPNNFLGNCLKGQLPKNTDILVTSTSGDWPAAAQVDLTKKAYQITAEEGMQILSSWVSSKELFDLEAARAIVDRFQFCPVVIAQAGRYIEKSKTSMNEYLGIFDQSLKEVLAQGSLPNPQGAREKDIYTSLKISLEEMVKNSQADENVSLALELLKCLVYLPSKNIPKPLIEKIINVKKSKLSSLLEPIDFLITKDVDDVSMHDLFQKIVFEELKDQINEETIMLSLVPFADHFEGYLLSDPEKAIKIFKYGVSYPKKFSFSETRQTHFYYALGNSYYRDSNYKDAQESYEKADTKNKKLQIFQGNDLIEFYHALAACYSRNKKADKSEEINQLGYNLSTYICGKNSLETSKFLYGIGVAECVKKNTPKGLEKMNEALNNIQSSTPPSKQREHTEAAILQSLGWHYSHICQYDKAKECYLKALGIRKEETTLRATTLSNYAWVCMKQGDTNEAFKLENESIRIRKHILGSNHHKLAANYKQLGIFNYELAIKKKNDDRITHLDEAIKYLKKTWEINQSQNSLSRFGRNLIRKMVDCISEYPDLQKQQLICKDLSSMIRGVGKDTLKNQLISDLKLEIEHHPVVQRIFRASVCHRKTEFSTKGIFLYDT